MFATIIGFFTGGSNIWLKVASVLGLIILLGGGVGYVYYLRTSLTISEQKVAVIQGALDAEKQKSAQLLVDVAAQKTINNKIEVQWKNLDIGKAQFTDKVKTKVDGGVLALKQSPQSEEARQKVEGTINALSNASNRCSEIAVNGATEADRGSQDLKDLCPELVK